MIGKLNKFHVEHDIDGARVMARSHQLTPGCISDTEIDTYIQLLKDDLDACAQEMKRRGRTERGDLFKQRRLDA